MPDPNLKSPINPFGLKPGETLEEPPAKVSAITLYKGDKITVGGQVVELMTTVGVTYPKPGYVRLEIPTSDGCVAIGLPPPPKT